MQTTDAPLLQSHQYAVVLDLISEGEVEGLVNGLHSVYLNEVPVLDSQNRVNFPVTDGAGAIAYPAVSLMSQVGTNDQPYMPGFTDTIDTPITVSALKIAQATPAIAYITNADYDAIKITLSSDSLYNIDDNGVQGGVKVDFKIETQQYGSSQWVPLGPQSSVASNPTLVTGNIANTKTYSSTSPVVGIGGQITWDLSDFPFGPVIPLTYQVSYNIAGGADVDWGPPVTWTLNDYNDAIIPPGENNGAGLTHEYTPIGKGTYIPHLSGAVMMTVKVRKISGDGDVWISAFSAPYISVSTPGPTLTFEGMATSTFERDYYVPRPGPWLGTWIVRVTRITADAPGGSLTLHNDMKWPYYSGVTQSKLRYPNCALVATQFNAQQFSSIPKRSFDMYGLKVLVPSNYDPKSRTYYTTGFGTSSGVWDGTFGDRATSTLNKKVWTDNPAWCFYDLLTNTRYGMGGYLNGYTDKWSLYAIGQYCDAVNSTNANVTVTTAPWVVSPATTITYVPGQYMGVPNGFGGLEPRLTCNLYISTREDAYKVVQDFAAMFRGITYWIAGQLTTVQDAPQIPVALYTDANVIDGMFTYAGSSIKTRHTVALVSWNDPGQMYKPAVEYVQGSDDDITRLGIIPASITALGCTSRGQAHRAGKWLLYTEKYETEVIKFKTGLDAAYVNPGCIIETRDASRFGSRWGGRITAGTTSSVELDAGVNLVAGTTYSIVVTMPSGLQSYQTVTSTPRQNFLAFSEQMDNSAWYKGGTSVVTANTVASPTGDGVTADTLVQTVAGGELSQGITRGGTTSNTVSVFVQSIATTSINLAIWWTGSSNQNVVLTMNPNTGTYTTSYATGASNLAYSITPCGNGWYRIRVSGTGTVGANTAVQASLYDMSAGPGSLRVVGWLLEDGLTMGSYFPSLAGPTYGPVSHITISGTFPETPAAQSMWLMSWAAQPAEQWRVISRTEADKGTSEIQALSFHPERFAYIEEETAFALAPATTVSTDAPDTPTNGAVKETSYIAAVGQFGTRLTLSWTGTGSRYQVFYKRGSDSLKLLETVTPTVDISPAATQETYVFQIYAVSAFGVQSIAPLTVNYTVIGQLAAPAALNVVIDTVIANKATLYWAASTSPDVVSYNTQYQAAGAGSWTTGPSGAGLSAAFTGLSTGVYNFRVQSVNAAATVSGWATISQTMPDHIVPVLAQGVKIQGRDVGVTTFLTGDVSFEWVAGTSSLALDYVFKDFQVCIYNLSNVLVGTYYTTLPQFTYTMAKNTTDNTPYGGFPVR